jgi:hypothetical protein
MPFTKFTNLDFDQIKTSIKDYLRANSTFTDFDFEGSNFSVLLDTLAYNTYITAFNSNMVVNESFLDSATLRENVVSLARNIGYVPRSRTASKALVSFDAQIDAAVNSATLTLQAGLVCVGNVDNTSYIFSIPENYTANITNSVASFTELEIYQGTFLKKQFVVDGSLDQRFIIDNPYVDTSTIKVYVKGPTDSGNGIEYTLANNIFEVTGISNIYLIQEVQDEKYELLFGDGVIGRKLENNSVITVSYIVTDGTEGNGASRFSFSGTFRGSSDQPITSNNAISITTVQSSQNGGNIESIDSIKYFAPRIYSSQYRAVTARDYEAIIKSIYPDTESVSVIGGEDLDPPEYGTVSISIKPKNGTFVSDFNKSQILFKLKQYSLAGINQKIMDLKILYVEIDSSIYYNYSQVSSVNDLRTKVIQSLTTYSNSIDLNKFGGRFKYSKIQQIIDNTDTSITSNTFKGLERGQFETTAAAHTTGAKVREVRYYDIKYDKAPAFDIQSPFISAIRYEDPDLVEIHRFLPTAYGAELIMVASNSVEPNTFAYLQGTNPLTGEVQLTSIAGTPILTTEQASQVKKQSGTLASDIRKYGLKEIVIDNPYITDAEHATKIADFMISKLAEPVPVININAMAMPKLQLGDKIRITSMNSLDIINSDYWVVSHSMSVGDSLDHSITLRKVV